MNKEKNTKLIFKNNFYFLKKAFKFEPVYFITKLLYQTMLDLRAAFLWVFLMQYVLKQFEENTDPLKIINFLIVAFVAMTLTYVLQHVLDKTYFRIKNERLSEKLQMEVFGKIKNIDYISHGEKELYDNITLASAEASERIIKVMDNTFNFIGSIIGIIAVLGLVLSMDFLMIFVCLLSVVISFFLTKKIAKLGVKYDDRIQILNKEDKFLKRVVYLPEYSKELRLTGLLSLIKLHLEKNRMDKDKAVDEINKKKAFLDFVNDSVAYGFVLDFLLTVYLVIRISILHNLPVSSFIGLVNAAFHISGDLEFMIRKYADFMQNGLFIERYNKFMKIPSKIYESSKYKGDVEGEFEDLTIENLSFTYPHSDFGLSDIDLHIKKGEKIAIVGENGSGKSTLINVILRLYEAENGSIKLNGKDIRDINLDSYRKHFGVLLQDFQMYATSIEKNTSMDKAADPEKVKKAMLLTGFYSVLTKTGADMKDQLTKEFDKNGTDFSGGEKQRLALSRCFYENHDLYIFDEPTSAMDIKQETLFYKLIAENTEGKTVIFTSHRLSSVKICDIIICMDKGKVAEVGTHDELYAKGGKYAEMYKAQERLYFGEN